MSISSLLNTSRRALNAQTTAISVIGNNIANVNTPGYSRQRAELVSTASINSASLHRGTGVEVNLVTRMADNFINKDLVSRIGERSKAEVKSEFLERAEAPFSLAGGSGTINYELNAFFSSLEDLQANPSDIALRTQVLQKGNDLAFTINETYNSLSRLQREADNRLPFVVNEVNRLTDGIAQLNDQISKSEVSEQEALNLRDQRDNLVQQLGELVSFQSVEDSKGRLTLYLDSGFTLVNGVSSNELEVSYSPSFAPMGGYQSGLDGGALGHIVFDYGGGVHGDLTHIIRGGSGSLAGLLDLRGTQSATDQTSFDADGSLVEIATHIELLARDLLLRFNLEYLGPDEDPGTPGHQPSSFDLDGNNPIPFGLFSFNGANAGNNFGDVDGDGLPSINDLNVLLATNQVPNFASTITFAVQDERSLAAARDLDPAPGATSWASGDSSNITALVDRRDEVITYSLGSINTNSTIDGMYSLALSNVGGKSARAKDDLAIFKSREDQIRQIKESISGVNLDEEFAQLIQFQRAFQGAARLIRIGDDLSNELLNLL
jgi:flagellar hook-associated protein 1